MSNPPPPWLRPRDAAELKRECADGDAVLQALGLDPQDYRTDGGSLNLGKIRDRLSAQKRAIELMRKGDATLLGETSEALAACQSEGQGWKLLAGNLAAWVARLARQLPTDKPSLRREAMEFLKAHSLVRLLRDDAEMEASHAE